MEKNKCTCCPEKQADTTFNTIVTWGVRIFFSVVILGAIAVGIFGSGGL